MTPDEMPCVVWIPVNERLPDTDRDILIAHDDGRQEIGTYDVKLAGKSYPSGRLISTGEMTYWVNPGWWIGDCSHDGDGITHWAELPASPVS